MPLPRSLGRINRHLANPIMRVFAMRIPPLAVIMHRGRRSGRRYRTPVMAFPAEGGYIIALTYGRDTDWERNLRAGGGGIVYRGRRQSLEHPRLVDSAEAMRYLPGVIWFLLGRIDVHEYLRVDAV